MKAWAKVFGSESKLVVKAKDTNRDSKVASWIPRDACGGPQQCLHKMCPPSRTHVPHAPRPGDRATRRPALPLGAWARGTNHGRRGGIGRAIDPRTGGPKEVTILLQGGHGYCTGVFFLTPMLREILRLVLQYNIGQYNIGGELRPVHF